MTLDPAYVISGECFGHNGEPFQSFCNKLIYIEYYGIPFEILPYRIEYVHAENNNVTHR